MSHEPVNLMLASAVNEIMLGSVDVNFDVATARDGRCISSISPLQHYMRRPCALNHICWYEYLECFEMIKQPRGTKRYRNGANINDSSDDSDNEDFALRERYLLPRTHLNYKTHMIVPRKRLAIVQYYGYSLRAERRRTTPEHNEQYAMSALLMFSPFISTDDMLKRVDASGVIIEDSPLFTSYYDSMFDSNGHIRENKISKIGLMVLRYNEDRWESKFCAQAQAKDHYLNLQKQAEAISDKPCHVHQDENVFDESSDSDIDFNDYDMFSTTDLLNSSAVDQAQHQYIDFSTLDMQIAIPDQNTQIYSRIHNTKNITNGFKEPLIATSSIVSFEHKIPFISNPNVTVTEISKLADFAIASLSSEHNHSGLCYDDVRISTLCLEQIPTVQVCVKSDAPEVDVFVYASLKEIRDMFNYDSNQARAFKIGAVGLLYSIIDDLHDIDLSDSQAQSRQIALLMEGLAGSGKSYVINGWKALGKSWGFPNAVLTVAITGIAASLVHGKTIASMFLKDSDAFAPIKLLCIDEVINIFFKENNIFI